MKISAILPLAMMALPILGHAQEKPVLRLARIFTDSAIMQMDRPAKIWGWAEPKTKVEVSLGGSKQTAKADAGGKWMVTFGTIPQQGHFQLVATTSKKTIALKGLKAGEVYIASGQSNMEWKLKQTVVNFREEIKNARYPDIRYFNVPNQFTPNVQSDLLDSTSRWTPLSPASAPEVSAVAYFFARSLHKERQVPVGIIQSEWGGTPAEAWTSKEALLAMGNDFDAAISALELMGTNLPAFKAEADKAQNEWIKALRSADKSTKPENGKYWTDVDYKASAWDGITVPGRWESNGLPGFDGIVLLRTTFTLAAKPTLDKALLQLGAIDDADSIWINGVKVAGGEGWNTPRKYEIPTNVLRVGKNVLVIKVTDTGGDGGLTADDPQLLTFTIDNNPTIKLAGEWQYRIATAAKDLPSRPAQVKNQNAPTVLFNAMINPIVPYAIRGVIWYQGESNAPRARQYQRLFPAMISDWRTRWGQGNFPFLYVQLANYKAEGTQPEESDWAELREAQTKTLSLPATGMACIIDIGEANDIHPRNKQDVGSRLYAAAKAVVYGGSEPGQGPVFKSKEAKAGKLVLAFDNLAGKPFQNKNKYGYIRGFAVAGPDNIYYWAKAEVQGDKVVVWTDKVGNPQNVRYAWSNNPAGVDLYNYLGLPMVPFRTDSLPGITQ